MCKKGWLCHHLCFRRITSLSLMCSHCHSCHVCSFILHRNLPFFFPSVFIIISSKPTLGICIQLCVRYVIRGAQRYCTQPLYSCLMRPPNTHHNCTQCTQSTNTSRYRDKGFDAVLLQALCAFSDSYSNICLWLLYFQWRNTGPLSSL